MEDLVGASSTKRSYFSENNQMVLKLGEGGEGRITVEEPFLKTHRRRVCLGLWEI